MPSHKVKDAFEELKRRFGGGVTPPPPPVQPTPVGSQEYIVQSGDSYPLLAQRFYGNESYTDIIRRANPSYPTLKPGNTLVFPDRRENPMLSAGNGDFWTTNEFYNGINSRKESRDLLPRAELAQKITPERGDLIYAGRNEQGELFMTTDENGIPLYYDKNNLEQPYTDRNTGLVARWGMLDDPLLAPTEDEQKSLTVAGRSVESLMLARDYIEGDAEQRADFRTRYPGITQIGIVKQVELKEAMEYARENEPADYRLLRAEYDRSFNTTLLEDTDITGELGKDYTTVIGPDGNPMNIPLEPSLRAEDKLFDSLRFIDLSEPIMGSLIAPTPIRAEEPGGDQIRKFLSVVWNGFEAIGMGFASATTWLFEQSTEDSILPIPVNPATGQKLTDGEREQWDLRGQEYALVNAHDYYRNAWDSSLEDIRVSWKDWAGDYAVPSDFASEEEYNKYQIAQITGARWGLTLEEGALINELTVNGVPITEAVKRADASFAERKTDQLAQSDVAATKAIALYKQNLGEPSIALMKEAQKLRYVSGYSPYFSWSWLNEPWREEAFLTATAQAELQKGSPLTNREVRVIRDNFINLSSEMVGTIFADGSPLISAALGPLWRGGKRLLKSFGKGVTEASGVELLVAGRNVNPLRPISWLAEDSVYSAAGKTRTMANNMAIRIAKGSEFVTRIGGSNPGSIAFDEAIELVAKSADVGDWDEVGRYLAEVTPANRRMAQQLVQDFAGGEGIRTQILEDLIDAGVPPRAVDKIMDLKTPQSQFSKLKKIMGQEELDEALALPFEQRLQDLAKIFTPEVQAVQPDKWRRIIFEAYGGLQMDEFQKLLERAKKAGTTLDKAALDAMQLEAGARVSKKAVARQFGKKFYEAFLSTRRATFDANFTDDRILIRAFEALGLTDPNWRRAVVATSKGLGWVRNTLFGFWLGLRPGWTVINFIDSSARALLMGASISDDTGMLWGLYDNFLKKADIPDEILHTMTDAGLIDEEGRILRKGAIESMMTGYKPYAGPFSWIKKAGEGRLGELVDRPFSKNKFLNALYGAGAVPFSAVSRGMRDYNAVMEFGWRLRSVHKHFTMTFNALDEIGLIRRVESLRQAGADDTTIRAFRTMWTRAYDNPGKLQEMLTAAAGEPRFGRRIYSMITPEDFYTQLDAAGVPKEIRTIIFNRMINDVEEIFEGAAKGRKDVKELVQEYLADARKSVNTEFAARTEDPLEHVMAGGQHETFAPRPGDVSKEPSANILGQPDNLVSSELKIGDNEYKAFGPDYYKAQELRADAMGKAGMLADELLSSANVSTARRGQVLATTLRRLDRLNIDVQQVGRKFWPRPTSFPITHPFRRTAWDIYEQLTANSALEMSKVALAAEDLAQLGIGPEDVIPSAQDFLGKVGFRFQTNKAGEITRVRISTRVAKQGSMFSNGITDRNEIDAIFAQIFGPGVQRKQYAEVLAQPYTQELYRSINTPVDDVAQTVDKVIRPATPVTKAVTETIELTDSTWNNIMQDLASLDIEEFARVYQADPEQVQKAVRILLDDEDLGAAKEFLGRTLGGRLDNVQAQRLVDVVLENTLNARASWDSFINAPWMGDRTLVELFGAQNTANKQVFNVFLDAQITELEALGYDSLAINLLRSEANTIEYYDSMFFEELLLSQDLPVNRGLKIPPPLPFWKMTEEAQTYLHQQTRLLATRAAVQRGINIWEDYLIEGLKDESLFFRAADSTQRSIFKGAVDESVLFKQQASDVARFGSTQSEMDPEILRAATGSDIYEGAIPLTQRGMLDYNNRSVFDNMMRFVMPFWMFPSRSLPFWLDYTVSNPELVGWYRKYWQTNRRQQTEFGMVDSYGRPLLRYSGYMRLPGTDLWINPLGPISFRYLIPIRMPYEDIWDSESGPMENALGFLFEFGRMYGISIAPWVSIPLYGLKPDLLGGLPPGSLISQPDLIPPWWTKDIRRQLRQSSYPGAGSMVWSPDVDWMDYEIENAMYEQALAEMEANPSEGNVAKVLGELEIALGYNVFKTDEYGAPTAEGWSTNYVRDDPRWEAARDVTEKDSWVQRFSGYMTGFYPKKFTDAEAQIKMLRNKRQMLRDAINGYAGVTFFGADPDSQNRYDAYRDFSYDTPEGQLLQLYGVSGWVTTPDGDPAKGDERRRLMVLELHRQDVSEAYWDAKGIVFKTLEESMSNVPIGANSQLRRSVWQEFFKSMREIENNPVYNIAERDWIMGYKPAELIMDNFRDLFYSMIKNTKPYYFKTDGESWDEFQQRLDKWEEEIPIIAQDFIDVFMITEVNNRTGPAGMLDSEYLANEIPGKRVLIPDTVAEILLQEANIEGLTEWELGRDSPYDAMNNAHTELIWDPYMQLQDQLSDLNNSYERDALEEKWLAEHKGISFEEYAANVLARYPDGQFTEAQLKTVFDTAGVQDVKSRLAPTNIASVRQSEAWDLLMWAGPGENFKQLKSEFTKLGGDADQFDVWYETEGEWAFIDDKDVYEKFVAFSDTLKEAATNLNVGPPSAELRAEWAQAKDLNNTFRDTIETSLGKDFYQLLGAYGNMSYAERKVLKEEDGRIETYYEIKEEYATVNQLWAKYYSVKFYEGGVGIAGQGGDKAAAESKPSSGGGKNRSKTWNRSGGRSYSYPRRGSSFGYKPSSLFVPMGYRASYDPNDLKDPRRLGTGGIGGSPYWPPGFGSIAPKGILREIIDRNEKDKPLSEPAKEFLASVANSPQISLNTEDWKDYVKWVESLASYGQVIEPPTKPYLRGGGGKVSAI